jgi:predicted permease
MSLSTDIRLAIRRLHHDRAYSSVAILTLGLGIAANTVIFSIVDGILLRPLAYREPGRLVVVNEVIAELARTYPRLPVAASHYYEWRDHATSFEQLAIGSGTRSVLTGAGEPEQVEVAYVSGNLLPTLGVGTQLGRIFLDDEDRPGHDGVVVLSDTLWARRFHRDRDVLGRPVTLDGRPRTIVGVLPAGFHLPESPGQLLELPTKAEAFVPIAIRRDGLEFGGPFNYTVIGRLRRGVTPQQALSELNALQAGIATRIPDKLHLAALVRDLQEDVTGAARTPLLILLGAVGAVLLIVCVNLANLALARGATRSREVAVRRALGATRRQLVRPLVAESVSLGLAGGTLGVALAWAGLRAVLARAPIDLPRLGEVQLDARVLLFAFGLSVASGLAFGVLPAWRAASLDPQQHLRDASRSATEGPGGRVTRHVLIALESALSAVLLTIAGLLVASFFHLINIDTGFDHAHQVTASLTLPPKAYPTVDERQAYYRTLLARVASLPGVADAGLISHLPLQGEDWVDVLQREGETRPMVELPPVNYRFCNPGYFRAMRIPFTAGGPFSDADRGRRVAVVSETTARIVWPGERSIGRRFTRMDPKEAPIEVVGVVRDVSIGLGKHGVATVYMPYWDVNDRLSMSLVLRTVATPQAVARSLQRAVWSLNPDTVVADLSTMQDVMSNSVATRRFQMLLTTVFAGSALLLACLGIYGVVSWSVARRRAEIGLRMALGAEGGAVHWMVVREGMRPVFAGLGLGLAGALAIGRLISSLLYGITAHDPLTLGGVAAALTSVAALACYLPARRATRSDPLVALRYEA